MPFPGQRPCRSGLLHQGIIHSFNQQDAPCAHHCLNQLIDIDSAASILVVPAKADTHRNNQAANEPPTVESDNFDACRKKSAISKTFKCCGGVAEKGCPAVDRDQEVLEWP